MTDTMTERRPIWKGLLVAGVILAGILLIPEPGPLADPPDRGKELTCMEFLDIGKDLSVGVAGYAELSLSAEVMWQHAKRSSDEALQDGVLKLLRNVQDRETVNVDRAMSGWRMIRAACKGKG